MSKLKYDYATTGHVVGALGGLEALEAVKTQVEALNLPACPFCGGEAVVVLGSAFGQPTVAVECCRCHIRTISFGPSYDYVTETMRTMHDSINTAARQWCQREGAA